MDLTDSDKSLEFPRRRIEEYVRETLGHDEAGAHTFDHIERVLAMALEMGKERKADIRILGAAALLHDIGRPYEEETGKSHSILSGEMGKDILRSVEYSKSEIDSVVQAIRTHRFSENLQPSTIEGEILSDADKLDAMGAIGIFRAIAQSSIENRGIEGFLTHAHEKLLKLQSLMLTDIGSQMAQERHIVLEKFVHQLEKEMQLIA